MLSRFYVLCSSLKPEMVARAPMRTFNTYISNGTELEKERKRLQKLQSLRKGMQRHYVQTSEGIGAALA